MCIIVDCNLNLKITFIYILFSIAQKKNGDRGRTINAEMDRIEVESDSRKVGGVELSLVSSHRSLPAQEFYRVIDQGVYLINN